MEVPSDQESVDKIPELDALIVLGAVMEWDHAQKSWTFPTVIDRYIGKLVMGMDRALATRELQNITSKILVTGGGEKHPETGRVASRARELARVIAEDLGVPKDKVTPIGTDTAGHIAGNVENVVAYLRENLEILQKRRIGILVPQFQQERAQLLFEMNPFFSENGIVIEWITVEDILEKRDPNYKKWREQLYATPEAETARKMEAKGIKDLKAGRYKPGGEAPKN